jgi:hypothetical protein
MGSSCMRGHSNRDELGMSNKYMRYQQTEPVMTNEFCAWNKNCPSKYQVKRQKSVVSIFLVILFVVLNSMCSPDLNLDQFFETIMN